MSLGLRGASALLLGLRDGASLVALTMGVLLIRRMIRVDCAIDGGRDDSDPRSEASDTV